MSDQRQEFTESRPSFAFHAEEFAIDSENDITLGPVVGSGQFASVNKGLYFGDEVAVKRQYREEKDVEAYLLRELGVLKNVHHANLVEYIGAYNHVGQGPDDRSYVAVVTEFMSGGDIAGYIERQATMGWKLRVQLVHGAVSGLSYLHSRNLMHRDIKSANMLVDKHWVCKLCDFGLVGFVGGATMQQAGVGSFTASGTRTAHRQTICGTDEYMAPELMFDEEYNTKADMYSLGVVLAEVLQWKMAGHEGFLARSPAAKFALDLDALRQGFPSDHPPSLAELCCQCLALEPDERPDAEDAVEWLAALLEDMPEDREPPPPMPEFIDVGRPSIAGAGAGAGDTAGAIADAAAADASADTASSATGGADGDLGPMSGGGVLYKQNRHYFRNWKRRWFIVIGQQLVYWHDKPPGLSVPEAAVDPARLPEGCAKLDLRGYRAVKCQARKGDTKARFQLKPSGAVADLPLRDFAAATQFEADGWVHTINNALRRTFSTARARGLSRGMSLSQASSATPAAAPSPREVALKRTAAEVVAWIRTTFAGNAKFMENMDAYEQAFIENEIDGATMSGLDKDSLVDAGIGNALHRSQIITKWNLEFGD